MILPHPFGKGVKTLENFSGIISHQSIPTAFNGFDPFRFFPQGQTRDLKIIGHFLNPPRIGQNGAGVFLQQEHVQIAHRLDHTQVSERTVLERRNLFSGSGVYRKNNGQIQFLKETQ